MTNQALFLADVIDESVPMQPLHPEVFDDYLSEGWRLLGFTMVRHNYSVCRGKFCHTIPLRIRLDGFTFSKSQRKLLQRNAHLQVGYRPIAIGPDQEALFVRHANRFGERRPTQVFSFLGPTAHREPVTGMEFTVQVPGQPISAYSYIHIGAHTISGTYCFFDPDMEHLSLGSYTMLLELQKAMALGKKYYYHGYCYDVPSQFDYKLNFNNLEAFDWSTGAWRPRERMPVRRWVDLIEPDEEQV
jgi:arginyl-tRNA--protein-N-Asp/Glu arginylyltransferase